MFFRTQRRKSGFSEHGRAFFFFLSTREPRASARTRTLSQEQLFQMGLFLFFTLQTWSHGAGSVTPNPASRRGRRVSSEFRGVSTKFLLLEHLVASMGNPQDPGVPGLNRELLLPEPWGHAAFCPHGDGAAQIPRSHFQPRKRIPQLHGVHGVVTTRSPCERRLLCALVDLRS